MSTTSGTAPGWFPRGRQDEILEAIASYIQANVGYIASAGMGVSLPENPGSPHTLDISHEPSTEKCDRRRQGLTCSGNATELPERKTEGADFIMLSLDAEARRPCSIYSQVFHMDEEGTEKFVQASTQVGLAR